MGQCHNSMMRPNVVGGGTTSIWRITGAILNKQSRTYEKEWSFSWGGQARWWQLLVIKTYHVLNQWQRLLASTEPVVHTSVKANLINVDFGVTGQHSSYILYLSNTSEKMGIQWGSVSAIYGLQDSPWLS